MTNNQQLTNDQQHEGTKEYDRHMRSCEVELAMCDRLLDLAIEHLKKSHEEYYSAIGLACKNRQAISIAGIVGTKLNWLLIKIHQSDNLMNEQPIRGLVANGHKYIGEIST